MSAYTPAERASIALLIALIRDPQAGPILYNMAEYMDWSKAIIHGREHAFVAEVIDIKRERGEHR